MIKKAMILAAGFGKRLNPLTIKHPKPLLKIGDETLLSNTLKFLEKIDIKEVIINVHYLKEQIIDYIKEKKFELDISVVKEENKILDTGGGVLNAIKHFSNKPFLIINPDTIWSTEYIEEVRLVEKKYLKNKSTSLLLVNKKKSFDQSFIGDFNFKSGQVNRNNKEKLTHIYTGLQISEPKAFLKVDMKVFSINKIWDNLIKNKKLYGVESNISFLHISTLKIYKSLIEKKFKV